MKPACVLCAFVLLAIPNPVQAQSSAISTGGYPPGIVFSRDDQTIRIREESTLRVRPDTLYLLMKVETEGAQLSQAIDRNKKTVEGFVEALKALQIDASAIRLTNFIVGPLEMGSGVSFARNVVITIRDIDRQPAAEVNKLIAEAQDLGARFGSQCITCIGSG